DVISSMLGAARSMAVENRSYAGVHVQLDADRNCWVAVMKYDNGTGKFVSVGGFPPQRMPADMAFGQISDDYVDGGGNYKSDVNADLRGFTTFNVIFAPDGSLMTGLVNGSVPQVETGVKIFGGDGATKEQQIWDHPASLPPGPNINEPGVGAITSFHYKTLEAMSDANRLKWLEKNGQFLCINQYTGKLLPTK
ncbi:MAG: hypothetical protein SVV80_13185, partial [Planctomycetota bacterium]|nr:hypothetical protein [Planctomycetota bacterium]